VRGERGEGRGKERLEARQEAGGWRLEERRIGFRVQGSKIIVLVLLLVLVLLKIF
jgi:hypothetical protein